MEPAPTAPLQADTPLRREAQQRVPATHVHGMGLLKALLLLLLVLLSRRHAAPARRDWFAVAHAASYGDTSQETFELSPAYRRLRAWIGWILRGFPNRGARSSGAAPLRTRPTRTARAPPCAAVARPPPVALFASESGAACARPHTS